MFTNYMKAKLDILDAGVILGINGHHSRGTVYTPERISKDMVYLLVRDYLSRQNLLTDSNEELLKRVYLDHTIEDCDPKLLDQKNKASLKKIMEVLKPLHIMDLASGTGLLLLAYLELIVMLMQFLDLSKKEILKTLVEIVENQVYAYDINENAINKYMEILETLMRCLDHVGVLKCTHVYIGNSLLMEHPFRVDLIIGNPPYIGEKGNLDIFDVIKKSTFGTMYYEGKMDYFYFFIYKAHQYLKPNGSLCYLTSNYFFTADGAMKLRTFIQKKFNFSQMLNFNDENIFKNKKLHACVYTLTPQKQDSIRFVNVNLELLKVLKSDEVYLTTGTFHFISDEIVSEILKKMEQKLKRTLEDDFEVKQGIVSGADRCEGQPIFVYTKEELCQIPQGVIEDVKPFYKNSAIKHFTYDYQTPYYIIYSDRRCKHEAELIPLLEPYREKLEKRREVVKGVRKWYELTWPREPAMFTRPKVVVPQRAKSNYFAYSEGSFHASADVYYILGKSQNIEIDKVTLKALSVYLNSYVVLLYLYFKGKRKGEALELYSTPLKKIPYEPEILERLSDLYDISLSVNENLNSINKVLYDYLKLGSEEREWLNKFGRKFL